MNSRLVVIILFVFSVSVCFSQKTWTGSSSSSWNDADNWSPSGIPEASDNVVISSGTVNINTTPNVTVGTLTLSGGTLTIFSSLTLTINSASTVTESGTLVCNGTLVLNESLTVEGSLDFGNGSIEGTGNLIIDGTFNWTSSSAEISGSGTATNNGITNLQGALLKTTFINEGTVNQSGTQTFILGDGGQYVNNGTHDFQNDRDINENSTGNLGMINNGSIIKSDGDLSSGRSDILIEYSGSGSVEAQVGNIDFRENSTQSGTITSQSGGAVRFPTADHTFDGATITGSGATYFNGGSITLSDDLNAANLDFSSGVISGVGDLIISGNLNWASGGTFGNQVDEGKLVTNGTVTLAGGDILAATWQNEGTTTWSSGSFTLNTNGILINNGTFDIQTDQDMFTSGSPQSITNSGTLYKSAGSLTTVLYPSITNSGTIEVQSGTLRVRGGSNAGTITTTPDGTIDISSQTFTNTSTGRLGGIGNITIGSTLSNEGIISPGASPGILTIIESGGSLNLTSTSQLEIELGGTTVGSDYDQLVVSGAFNLDGQLNATLIDPFVPNPLDTFDIVDYSSITGAFENTTAADLDSLLLQIIDDEGFLKLIVNYHSSVSTSICEGESIFLEGADQTVAGVYRDTLTATIGIDSIVVTTLSVNPTPTVVANATSTAIQEGESVTLSGSGASSYAWDNGVINGVAFTPTVTTTYTVRGTDGNGCTNTDMITVSVNNPPVVNLEIPDQVTNEKEAFNYSFPENSFTDPNSDLLTYSASQSDDGSLPEWLTFTSSTRTFSGTPNPEDIGALQLKVIATDPGGLTAEDNFELTIQSVNEVPVLTSIGDQTGDELSQLTFTVSATDGDGDPISYTLDASSIAIGMMLDASSGVFQWTPAEDQDGEYTVTIGASDAEESDEETITITINEVNTPPVIVQPDDQTVMEGEAFEIVIEASDTDLPANTLTFTLDATSMGKGMTIGATDGTFKWTPSNQDVGTHEVMVSVSDEIATVSSTFSIDVEDVLGASLLNEEVMSIYPNPAFGIVTINTNHLLPAGSVLNIFNSSGKVVGYMNISPKSDFVRLDVSGWSSGVYHLQFIDQGKLVSQKRLIVKK